MLITHFSDILTSSNWLFNLIHKLKSQKFFTKVVFTPNPNPNLT